MPATGADCKRPQAVDEARESGTDAGGRYLSPEASGAYTATVTDRMLLEVAVTTGLRWGENIALQIRDLTADGVEPCLRIRHAQDNSPLPIFEFTGQSPSRVSPSRPTPGVPAFRRDAAASHVGAAPGGAKQTHNLQMTTYPVSIVVPAHNEAAVIDRLLRGLLASAAPAELEIVVVCNGCTDNTATRARAHGPSVKVLETPIPSKQAALRLGDAACSGYPRLYVDADVELGTHDVRALTAALRSGLLVAVPSRHLALEGCPWAVRSYLAVWEALPTVRDGLFGRGVIALTEEAHRRVTALPEMMADDLGIHHAFAADEGAVVTTANVVVRPPRTLADLLRRRARVVEGAREVQARLSVGPGRSGTSPADVLALARARHDLWPGLAIFVVVTVAARTRATVAIRCGRAGVWHRDNSSRTE